MTLIQDVKSTSSCPHLGFNPTPGDTDSVRTLHRKLFACAKVLQDTHDLVTRLLDGSYWKGDAAVAFREQLDGGPLPLNLKNAAHSVRKAARQLERWEGELDDFQRRAKGLEQEAEDARDAVDRAKGRAAKTEAGDDSAVEEAEAALERIRHRARLLAKEHEDKARHRAGKIRDATKKLAPHEPGWFDEALDWLADNLPDILSFTAGVIGVVALLFAGPLGMAMVAALMLAGSALSATALTLRISDAETLESLMDGFTTGELDADFWSNFISVGADAVSALPGLGAVAKGVQMGARAAGHTTETLSLGQKLAVYGTKTMDEAKSVAGLENALIAGAVRGADNPTSAANAVSAASGIAGVGTAGFGLYNKATDAKDSKYKDGTVAGIDGTRLLLDSGGIWNLAQHLR
ncbi:hypothetical protein RKD23_004653 [Streptomyces sp. SAI-170]|uniref:hypothetical protein n=1 Tax=Streptomyces sp. SAI-170 TaxID=3377729 RepID=UPI003C7E0023